MAPNPKSILLILATLAVLSCKESDPPSPFTQTQQTLITELNSILHPITSSETETPTDDLSPLDIYSTTKILGLGEATHGTREFFQMKHRIFKYMVEKHGYKSIAFEMDVAEAMIFEDLIQGKTNDDIEFVMKQRMFFWTWKTREVLKLLLWMKDYNQGKPASQRIHFYGFDCQTATYNVDALVALLSPIDATFSTYVQAQFADFKHENESADTTNNTLIRAKVEEVHQNIIDKKNDLIGNGMSLSDFETALHLARVIVQTQDLTYLSAKDLNDYVLCRDLYMSENVKWISDSPENGNKICLWAHNGHIRNSNTMAMGTHLTTAFGAGYKKVGFAFSRGKFSVVFLSGTGNALTTSSIDVDPLTTSTNFLFHHASTDNFLLRFDQLKSPASKAWFHSPHDFLSIGAVYDGAPENWYYNEPIGDEFDVIIYFDETTNSLRL